MFQKYPISSLVPHDAPMLLINDPYDVGDDWARASVLIGEDSMFYQQGYGVPAWISAEYMAQTIAMFAGAKAKLSGDPVKIGFLVGSRAIKFDTDFFRLGSLLSIYVQEEWRDKVMAVFDCSVVDSSEMLLAAGKINVFQPEDPLSFIEESKS